MCNFALHLWEHPTTEELHHKFYVGTLFMVSVERWQTTLPFCCQIQKLFYGSKMSKNLSTSLVLLSLNAPHPSPPPCFPTGSPSVSLWFLASYPVIWHMPVKYTSRGHCSAADLLRKVRIDHATCLICRNPCKKKMWNLNFEKVSLNILKYKLFSFLPALFWLTASFICYLSFSNCLKNN